MNTNETNEVLLNSSDGGNLTCKCDNNSQQVPAQQAPVGTKPNNFLAWAILSTIFCCVPFGICSIVYAAKVDSLWYSGNYDEARKAARTARTWFWWSFGLGLFFGVIYLVYCVLLGVAIGMGY